MILMQISSRYFCAGLVLGPQKKNENHPDIFVVTRAAPIVGYMVGWTKGRVEMYCRKKRWTIKIVEERVIVCNLCGDVGDLNVQAEYFRLADHLAHKHEIYIAYKKLEKAGEEGEENLYAVIVQLATKKAFGQDLLDDVNEAIENLTGMTTVRLATHSLDEETSK